MAKALNIDLNVNANTSLARQELSLLQNTLKQLTTASGEISKNLTTGMDLSKTIAQVSLLRALLQSATNVDTGVLSFTKLNLSIQLANTSLLDYGRTLNSLGPTGQKAFLQLATAVSKSEIPIGQANGMLKQFGTTMKNTLRWQASSMLLHGTVNAILKAWNYAQKLDRSLTDIQIVTKQSDAQMAKFAENANKAARALSTSTTAYTDAALIYYQLGLNDALVKQRTDVTVKMANVTGRTAEKVSDQMTAIWNNFDNGSKSLEYYADVITALGAATASSSDEIATGLSKFAAVADTVGLSYENATAALATITATTRQSADSVGNGLKTLFSRLQSLSLGKTLEDGVNLTKYTKALNTVGVSALDAAGNLRSMDSILADLGERWGSLSTAQLNALAQTVGGVRLYVTFTALMDNYDFFKDNIQIAKNASGELLKQADIYDKSWAAARKHVQASAEAIYSDLIDDKFFTKLTNGFAGALGVVDNFIDGIGGIKGALFAAGTAMATFGKQGTAAFLDNSINSIRTLFPSGVKALQDERTRILKGYLDMLLRPTDLNGNELSLNYAMQQQGLALARILPLLNEFAQNLNSYNLLQLLSNLNLLDTLTTRGENIVLTAESVMAALTLLDNINTLLYNTVLPATKSRGAINIGANLINGGNFGANTGGVLSTGEGSYIRALTELLLSSLNGAADFSSQASQTELARLSKFFEDYNGFEIDNGRGGTVSASYALRNAATPEDWTRIIGSIRNAVAVDIENEIKRTSHGVTDAEIKETKNIAMQSFNTRLSIYLNEEKNRRANEELDDLAKKGFLTVPTNMSIGTGMAEAASMLGGLGMGLSILRSGVSNLSNPNMSSGDKFLSLATSIGMATPMLSSVGKNLKNGELLPFLGNLGTVIGEKNRDQGNLLNNAYISQIRDKEVKNIAQTMSDNFNAKGYLSMPVSPNAFMKEAAELFDKESVYWNDTPSTYLSGKGYEAGNNLVTRGLSLIGKNVNFKDSKLVSGVSKLTGLGTDAAAGGVIAAGAVAALVATVEITKLVAASIESTSETITRYQGNIDTASTKAQKVSEEYSTLVSKVDVHNKQLDKLNELESGSLEYRLAQIEANKTASEIIAENGLTPDLYTFENGIYNINESALLQAREKALDKIELANTLELAAKAVLANYNTGLSYRDIMSQLTPGYGGDMADYSLINLIKLANAQDLSKYNDNEILALIGLEYNLGSGAEVARLIQNNLLESQIMVTSGAAATNQALLNSVATLMNNGKELNDLQKLIIDDLADNVTTSNELADAANNGLDSSAIAWRSLGHFRKEYIQALQDVENMTEAEAEAQMRNLEQDEAYLNADRHGKQVILTSYIANMRTTQKALELLKDYQDALADSNIDYSDWQTLTQELLQERYLLNAEMNSIYAAGLGTEGLTEAEYNAREAIGDEFEKAKEAYLLLAAALGVDIDVDNKGNFLGSNFNYEDYTGIVNLTNQFRTAFGGNVGKSIFTTLSKESKQFRADLQNLVGDDAILTLFNLKSDGNFITQYKELMAELDGKGLFEALYDSEGFKDSLADLTKEFEKSGKVSADSVLSLAESSETLSNYLDISGVNAQGLANTIATLAKGDLTLDRLSSSLIYAYSAAGELGSSMADTYKFISDYDKGTSVDTIGNFYKNLESTIYKSVNGGNLLDEPLLNTMEALFGQGGADRWRVLAAQASDFSNLREAKDFLFNDSSFADLWTYLLKIYKTGDLSPLYQQLLTSGNFNLSLTLWQSNKNRNVLTSNESGEAGLAIKDLTDIMRWNNGLVDITDDEAFLEMFLTQEEFFDYVMSTDFGKTWGEDTVRAMINEYGGLNGKNATVSQGWYKNGIIAGGRNLTTSGKVYDEQGNPVTDEAGNQLENPDLINADNLREYLLTYEATLASLSLEDLRKFMANMGINLGGSDEAVNAYLQSLFTGPEKGTINIDAIVNAVARANENMVDMGAGFKYSEADYKTTKQAYNKYNGKGEDDTAFTEYLREGGTNVETLDTSLHIQNLEDAIAKFTAIGFTEDLALKQLDDAIKNGDLTGVSRQVWDENTHLLITAYQDVSGGETVQEFQERTGGTDAEYYAEMQKQLAKIDAWNEQAFINNEKLRLEHKNDANYDVTKDDKYMEPLQDIIDATGKIVDNTGTSAKIAEEQNEAATAGSEKGTNKPSAGDKAFDEEGNEVTYNEDAGGWVNDKGELIENQETVTNSYSSTPTPTPTPGTPGEKPGGKYGLTVTQTITGKDVSTTASFASQEQYDSWKKDSFTALATLDDMAHQGMSDEAIEAKRKEYIEQGLILPEGTVTTITGLYASGLNNYIPGFASGYQGPATVGELGPEMWVHNGQVDIVGLQGRESIWVNPSDTILTAGLTDRLLNGRKPGFSFGYGDNYGSSGGGRSRRGSGSGEKDDDDKWKDSWEPYHEISREVQRLTTDVENLNTEMERAFGVEKIQKMDEELELLDLRLQQEADYIAEAEQYITEYAEYLPDGTEVVDGVILNYDALLEKYLKDIYQAQEDRDKDKLEKLQREWQKIQLYEQHTDKLEERRQEQLNLLYQKADLMLQQLQYSIDQVNNSLDESESLIDYMLNHMNTDMFKMAESIALVGDATDITIQKMELAKQSIQDYEDMLGTEYANDEELVNNILQERNNLLKLNQELDKQRDNVIKKLTYTIQEFNNELKKATKLLSNYNTLIKNYTDLSELMGLSTINNTEQIDKLNDALKNNMGLNIQATKSQLETNQAQIAQMEADFEANPWMREAYDDVYQKLIEEGQGLSVTLSNNLQSMLNFIVKEFETELDRALTSFQDQITKGFGTWDELTSAANSLQGAQDVNTKAYDRVYQLNTLIRDMDSYMNDMTSAKNHNSILKFQELIKKLKADNTDLSQEELDVLRAQFELMQAQFDLEDAQNAKNQVRLQRDMNGNWGYVYTADEDAMAEAQLNVDDKLKAYLDAVTALLQVQGEYMGTVAELEIQEQELRNELNQLGHTDEDEERRAQLLKQIAAIEEQLGMYKNNLLRMQDTLNEAVDSGHGYIQEIWDESNELFNASLGALPQMMLESIATTEEFFDVLSNAEIAFVDRTTAAKDAYMEQYEEWAPYLEQFNNGLGDMATQSEKAVENLDALNELYLQEFTDAMEAAVKWEQEYGQEMEAIVKLNLIFIDLLDQMINGLRGLDSMDYSVSFRRVTDDSEVSAMTSMDSGGYTGAWGTSGKIAMLHEKEQVFNAQDTLNLLTAALILRTIDASANSMAIGLNNMITPKINGVTQQVDLTVNISASFPNAVNHFEIEEAFNNLTNKAVQFANRKNA